jgi:hypothetical protein
MSKLQYPEDMKYPREFVLTSPMRRCATKTDVLHTISLIFNDERLEWDVLEEPGVHFTQDEISYLINRDSWMIEE